MKEFIFRCKDDEALQYADIFLQSGKEFTCRTVVAADPIVYAATQTAPAPYDPTVHAEAMVRETVEAATARYTTPEPIERELPKPERPQYRTPQGVEKDPKAVEAGLKGRNVGKATYTRVDYPTGRVVQRLTPDGFTSMEIVERKLRQIGGRRFHIDEIKALSETSGFQPQTLLNQLSILTGQGHVVRLNKYHAKATPEYVKANARPPKVDAPTGGPMLDEPSPGEPEPVANGSNGTPSPAGKVSAPTSSAPAPSTPPQASEGTAGPF